MNLSLAFPEIAPLDRRLETALAQFDQLAERENSPITAIRRIPALAAQWAPPAWPLHKHLLPSRP